MVLPSMWVLLLFTLNLLEVPTLFCRDARLPVTIPSVFNVCVDSMFLSRMLLYSIIFHGTFRWDLWVLTRFHVD